MSGIVGHRGLLLDTGGGGGWVVAASFTPNAVNDGWSGYTFRQAIDTAGLAGATKLRFTFQCASGKSLSVAKAYAGNRSADYAFAATPAQILFGGNPGFAVSGLVDTVSDEVLLTVSGTAIVVSAYFNSTTSLVQNTGGTLGGNGYYLVGDDASNVTPPVYDIFGGSSLVVTVEKFV